MHSLKTWIPLTFHYQDKIRQLGTYYTHTPKSPDVDPKDHTLGSLCLPNSIHTPYQMKTNNPSTSRRHHTRALALSAVCCSVLGAGRQEKNVRSRNRPSLNLSHMTTDCGEPLQPKSRAASRRRSPGFSSCSPSTETQLSFLIRNKTLGDLTSYGLQEEVRGWTSWHMPLIPAETGRSL